MKKSNFLTSAAAMVLVAGLFISGCTKDDTTSPVVTLNGSSSMNVSLNSSFTDPGATATDDKDGSLSVSVSGTVNKDLKGDYVLTYSATDAAGNVGTATRTVTVQNDAEYLAGTYTDSLWVGVPLALYGAFTQTITASATVNNRIIFSKFGNYANNNAIYAGVTGTSVDITNQTAVGIGASGCTHTFSPNGTGIAISQIAGKYRFSIKYTDTQAVGGSACLAAGPDPTEDIFHEQ